MTSPCRQGYRQHGGGPDFDTPAYIRQAACEAIERGETRYTAAAGTLALREAIAEKFQRVDGLSYSAKDIIITIGASACHLQRLVGHAGAG